MKKTSSKKSRDTVLKLTIPGFPYYFLPVSCGYIGFLKKIFGLVLAWKSGLKAKYTVKTMSSS